MTRKQPEELEENKSQDSTWSNPAKIARKVRELAHRSHRALKAGARPYVLALKGAEDRNEEVRDLHKEVSRLQQTIHAQHLGVLIPWVDALWRQLDDRLNSLGKAGTR